MKLFFNSDIEGKDVYEYVFRLIGRNKGFPVEVVSARDSADVCLSYSNDSDFQISRTFYGDLQKKKFNHSHHFINSCIIKNNEGTDDLLSTIFYCVNSIQEYNSKSDDVFNRFQFSESYQKRFNNIHINLVQQCIDRVCASHTLLSGFVNKKRRSRIFLSHDIDTVYGALKEDGFAAVKKGRLDLLFGLALRAIVNKPDWANFDRIMDIEEGYGYRSTFYWLLNKDKMNADYDAQSPLIRQAIKNVQDRGWENGLHKSLKNDTLEEESQRIFGFSGGNRFHYLNFILPEGYEKLSNSTVKLDSSLGFTEQWGFRNSYGLPFMPFNLQTNKPYDFVEVPMHVMDRTFFRDKMDVKEVYRLLTDWVDANKTDCIFTLNFHNNFFSNLKYKGFEWLYKELLAFFRDQKLEGINQRQIMDEFYFSERRDG